MKLIRADEHLEALNTEVVNFLAIRPYEIVTPQDDPGGQIRAQVVYRHPPPDRLLMLIGDALHNLRSAFDHLAWSLAGTSANSHTEFPIFIDPAKFCATDRRRNPARGSGFYKMHGMPTAAQGIIESLQPYNRRHGLPEGREPLWLLQQLSIENKHHTLNLVASGVEGSLHIGMSRAHPAYGLTGMTGHLTLEDGAASLCLTAPVD